MGRFLGVVGLPLVIPTVFASPLEASFANALLLVILHLLPIHYMAGGLLDAL